MTLKVKKPLYGHSLPETAYLVDDYPYGRKLRCKIRFWIEFDDRRGFRLGRQTTNPKKGDRWNQPHYSTYSLIAGCLYLDHNDHVQWAGLSEYSSAEQALEFARAFPECDARRLLVWAGKKKRVAEDLGTGKVAFTVDKIPQPRSEAQKAEDLAEAKTWREVVDTLLPPRGSGTPI